MWNEQYEALEVFGHLPVVHLPDQRQEISSVI